MDNNDYFYGDMTNDQVDYIIEQVNLEVELIDCAYNLNAINKTLCIAVLERTLKELKQQNNEN